MKTWIFDYALEFNSSTVGINPRLSDLRDQGLQNWTGGTWNIIKLIGMNSRFALIHKKAQDFSPILNPEPPDDWSDALDHLAIGLVANKCTKLSKISEIFLLSLGLSFMKIPLW